MNPAFRIFGECNSERFGVRSSKPFQIRQLEELDDDNIRTQKILEVGHPDIPPWFIPEVCICPKSVTKKDQPEEIRSKFLEHDSEHRNVKKLYTDSSKSQDGVGCAVVCDWESYIAKLPDSSSVFTAEATAIVNALELVHTKNFKSVIIYSDSSSVLEALKKFYPLHPLIQKAQEWLFHLSVRHKSVQFCWVPAHSGIQGNEVADREAKDATRCKFLIKKIPYCDMRRAIRIYVLNRWQQRWSSPLLGNNKKYKKIREKVSFWESGYNRNRRFEVVLTCLRIGHTRLTHKFILEGSSAPECDHCDGPLSVEHILVHCSRYDHLRRKYHLNGKNICEILNENVDIDNLMGYLQDAKIFNEI